MPPRALSIWHCPRRVCAAPDLWLPKERLKAEPVVAALHRRKRPVAAAGLRRRQTPAACRMPWRRPMANRDAVALPGRRQSISPPPSGASMHSPDAKAPPLAIWALGLTQIVGYGTLFYSFSVLAPAMALELALPQQWVFGALSAALFLGSLFAPIAGRWADRFGAGRVMTIGSLAASAALAACALSPGRASFVAALVAMELASCFVLYATAFAAIVQIGPVGAQRSITHLTLIAGFASTLFWPLTSLLHEHLTWREVYLIFAALNLLLCLPIHAWLMRLSRQQRSAMASTVSAAPNEHAPLDA